ncbi:MAG: dicarboxylate/amino acid:cation symporter [Alphaproteobacteria bacterium]|nr:dicarboxylate/amino acid:cation symporter [Alphaproteobacteria bacterium]
MLKKDSLCFKILMAIPLGIITGLILHNVPNNFFKTEILINDLFTLLGQSFLSLMQMIVMPLMFCSLICGCLSINDSHSMKETALKIILFFIISSIFAIFLGMCFACIFQPGTGLDLHLNNQNINEVSHPKMTFITFVLSFIPKNPIKSMKNGDLLSLVIFALLIGISASKCTKKESVFVTFLERTNEILANLTMSIIKIAPYSIFCLLAKTFSNTGFIAIMSIIKYLSCTLIAILIYMFVFYPALLFFSTKLNPVKFLKKFLPAILFAFSTASSNATVPISMDTLEKKIGISKKFSSFAIPLGTAINLNSFSITLVIATIFIAQIHGIQLSFVNLLTLFVMSGVIPMGAGIPGATAMFLPVILNAVHLPIEEISLIISVDIIADMFSTASNVTGNAIITTIISVKEDQIDLQKYND